MKKVFVCLSAVLLFAGCNSGNQKAKVDIANAELGEYQLIWSDEFDYNGLPDSTKWDYDTEGNEYGWGNNEEQYYTKAKEKIAYVKWVKSINKLKTIRFIFYK